MSELVSAHMCVEGLRGEVKDHKSNRKWCFGEHFVQRGVGKWSKVGGEGGRQDTYVAWDLTQQLRVFGQ